MKFFPANTVFGKYAGLWISLWVLMAPCRVDSAIATQNPLEQPKALKAIQALSQTGRQHSFPTKGNFLSRLNGKGTGRISPLAIQARTAVAAVPDSVMMEDRSSGTFEPAYSYKFIRNSSGKLTQMRVWIPATFPLPAIQFGSAQATYSTQGALTQLSFFVTFPTTTEALRLLQPVDSRGNCTSAKRYEEDTTSGNLALVSGDSLQYTYTGNNITSFVLKSYDEGNGLWLNVLRITSITSNANSQPTGFDAEFWDESTNSWDTSKFRFSGVTWNAGFASWFNFLGSDNYMATAEQFLAQGFKDIPRIEFNPLPLASRPDQYSISVFNGNNFVNFERSYSVVTGGRIQRITYQEWTGTAWVSLLREVFTWTGNQLTLAMSEDSSSGSWQIPSTSSRDLWTYNNNGDLTEESSEFRDSVGAPWRLYIGNQYAITYQPGNPSRIQNWIEKDYDPSGGPTGSGVWDTLSRYTLYYGAPSSVCPGCETDLKLSVYPNPMTDQILVRGLKAQTQWHVTDLNGRLITQGGFQGATSEEVLHVNAINWQAGWYLLHLVTDNGYRTVHRMVKH